MNPELPVRSPPQLRKHRKPIGVTCFSCSSIFFGHGNANGLQLVVSLPVGCQGRSKVDKTPQTDRGRLLFILQCVLRALSSNEWQVPVSSSISCLRRPSIVNKTPQTDRGCVCHTLLSPVCPLSHTNHNSEVFLPVWHLRNPLQC